MSGISIKSFKFKYGFWKGDSWADIDTIADATNINYYQYNGSANINYIYNLHNNYEVVVSASGTITPDSLDNGSETTSCTQQYSRSLEDDGEQNCDAGHIQYNHHLKSVCFIMSS